MREMSKQEEILMKKKREIERKMKEQHHHHQAHGKKAGGGGGGGRGGSISSGVALPRHPTSHEPTGISITEVKEENYSTSHKSKSSGQGTNKLKAYCQSVPKQTDAAHTYSRQDNVSPPYPDDVKPHLLVDGRVSTPGRPHVT
ncbi:hypothetical protein E2C01_041644 [Portunus trituberculatus]|uniref:Uncharacterized protein n=1 Tax=Portunus trituberculatus TaxID=210409 RepID=A0A5B7FS94_PORTR|nr:hypothetical protein [Portunus trituberculatus]